MPEHPESFPVNALVPVPGTPLEGNEVGWLLSTRPLVFGADGFCFLLSYCSSARTAACYETAPKSLSTRLDSPGPNMTSLCGFAHVEPNQHG